MISSSNRHAAAQTPRDVREPSRAASDCDDNTSYEIRAWRYQVVAKDPSGNERVVVYFTSLMDAEAFVAARQRNRRTHHSQPISEGVRQSSDIATTHALGARSRRPIPSAPAHMKHKTEMPYRAEVQRLHRGTKLYGWLVFARGVERPVAQSESGYHSEADAWSAAGSVVRSLEHRAGESGA